MSWFRYGVLGSSPRFRSWADRHPVRTSLLQGALVGVLMLAFWLTDDEPVVADVIRAGLAFVVFGAAMLAVNFVRARRTR